MARHTEITAIEFPEGQKELLEKASNAILVVPENWPEDPESRLYAATSQSVLKLLSKEKIPIEALDSLDSNVRLQDHRGLEWIAPTLFVSGLLLIENPAALTIALNVLLNYVIDIFKGRNNNPVVRLNVVYISSKRKNTRKVRFKGPASSLVEVEKILSDLEAEE